MRKYLLASLLALSTSAHAAETWLLSLDRWGNASSMTMHLDDSASQLSGTLDGDTLTGTRIGKKVVFDVLDKQGRHYTYQGSIDGATMQGSADFPGTNNATARARHAFSARRLPERTSAALQLHEFVPRDYANAFSATRAPVLTIWPGDTVHTATIDSGGVDEKGVTRAL